MNILDLKRAARGHTFRWNDRGTDSSGTGSANTGGDNSGGMSDSSGSSSSSGSSGSSSNYDSAGNYIGVGSLSYGLNPGDEGYGLGTGGLQGGPGTTFGSGSVGGPDMGPQPNSRMSDLKDTFRENPSLGFLANIPGIRQVATLAGFLTAAADYLSPRQRQTLAEQAGITEQDFTAAKEAVSSGSEAKFDTNFSAAGTTTPTPGAATKAAGPMDDIFSHFAGGDSGFKMPELAAYDADPSGMIAGAKGYMDDYNATYKPYASKMMAEVDRYGSPEYIAQQRGMAMADVQQQYDNSMGQNTREMARMGVNPSSGRMAAMRQQGAIQSAAAKVNAAAKAEGMAKDKYMGGLSAVNSMGMDTAKMGQGWAAMGNDAAKTKMAYGLGAAEFGLKGQTALMDNARGWGQIAANKYASDKGLVQTQMNNDARATTTRESNQSGLTGLFLQSVLKPSKSSNWWDEE